MREIIIFITTASGKEADSIARVLVKRKLAACVNIVPSVRSVYTWKGKVETAKECLLIVKTRRRLFNEVEKTVKRMHSYECPEIIAMAISKGSRDYLRWLKESTMKALVFLCTVVMISACGICRAESKAGDAYFNGVNLAAEGRLEEAKAEFERSLADESVYPYAKLELHAIGDVLSGKADKETALLVFRGKQLATQKKWDDAIASYNKAIKKNPVYAYAFVSRGIAYMSQGNLDKAISNYSEAIDVDPEFTEAYQNRGVLYEYRGQFNKAITDFNKAVAADPGSAVLYFNRGMAYVYKSQYDKALPDLSKAIELKPNYAKAYINKGLVCEELGMRREAIDSYKNAVQYDNSETKEITKDAQDAILELESGSKKDK